MADVGVRVANVDQATIVDQILGVLDGSVRLIVIERLVALLMARLGPTYATRAELLADLDWPDGVVGYVSGDATAGYNGIYRKDGGAGAGGWTRVGDLPTSAVEAAQIAAEVDRAKAAEAAGSILRIPPVTGTGDAMVGAVLPEQAHIEIGLNTAVRWLQPAANTAADPTFTLGGVTYTLKQRTGATIDSGTLLAGQRYWGIVTNTVTPTIRVQDVLTIEGLADDLATALYADNRVPLTANLYDPAQSVDGKYVTNTGALATASGFRASGMIAVLPATTYRLAKAVAHLAFYRMDGSFLSYVAGVAADTDMVTPSSAAFVRFSGTTVNMTNQMMVRTNAPIGTFRAFGWEDPTTAKRARLQAIMAARSVMPKTLNLFDPARSSVGFALDGNGNTYAISGYTTTDYIAVVPGENVVTNFGSVISWYTEDYLHISQTTGVSSGVAVVVPAGTYFLRAQISNSAGTYATAMLLRQSALPTTYTAFGWENPAVAGQERTLSARLVVDEQLASDRNIFDKTKILVDKAISADNGGLYTVSGWAVTPRMPVKAGDAYVANYGSNSAVFTDLSGKFVSSVTNQTAGVAVPVPTGAHYVQFQFSPVSRAENMHVVRGSTPPAGYKAFGGADGWLPHQGKRLITLGDSITYNAYFLPTVLAGTGMALEANHSQPGRAMRDALRARAALGETAAYLTASDFDAADNVLIALGTNDYGGNRPLGSLADATPGYGGSGSFYNDTFTVLDTLLGWKPTLSVMLATPLQRYDDPHGTGVTGPNPSGSTLAQYRQAIVELAQMFSVPVADCFTKSGFSYKTAPTFSGDLLHPNLVGSYGQGRVIASAWNAS